MMPSSFPCVVENIRLGLVFNLPSCELLYDLTQYLLRGPPKTLSSWKAIHIGLTVSQIRQCCPLNIPNIIYLWKRLSYQYIVSGQYMYIYIAFHGTVSLEGLQGFHYYWMRSYILQLGLLKTGPSRTFSMIHGKLHIIIHHHRVINMHVLLIRPKLGVPQVKILLFRFSIQPLSVLSLGGSL